MKSVPYICGTIIYMRDEPEIIKVPIGKLVPYARNSRTHSEAQVKEIAASIKTFGFTNPVLIDGNYEIIAGHGRVLGAELRGMKEVPCIMLDYLSADEKRAYVIADNKLAENGGWDMKTLAEEVAALKLSNFDVSVLGFDSKEMDKLMQSINFNEPDGSNNSAFGKLPQGGVTNDANKVGRKNIGSLADKFVIPPFTILDARLGWWQTRKRTWVSLGISGELGRSDKLIFTNTEVAGAGMHNYRKENGLVREDYEAETVTGSSVFDPVLCELAYKWFCPPKGAGVLDPFHGGEVRGVVASHLGIKYTGVD